MDADGSHQPEELPLLLRALEQADVVLGSRWIAGGRVLEWPRRRRWLSRAGNAYTGLALGMPVRDATSGYRAYRRSVLEELDLRRVVSRGYCFQIDLTRRAVSAGCAVVEVPITFVERVLGTSKLSGRIVVESLVRITCWGILDRGRQLTRMLGPRTRRPGPGG